MTYLVQQTSAFAEWHSSLKDMRGKIAIARRIERAARGNLGDVKALVDGLSELRVDVGPGYRLYFVKREKVVIVLLAGGDKSTQQADIRKAKKLAKEV